MRRALATRANGRLTSGCLVWSWRSLPSTGSPALRSAAQVLSPLQCAQIVVQSFPYIINIMSLATLLAQDAGEAPEQDCITLPDPLPPPHSGPPVRSLMQPVGKPSDPLPGNQGWTTQVSRAHTLLAARLDA